MLQIDFAAFYDRANPLYWMFWSDQGFIHPGLFDHDGDPRPWPEALRRTRTLLLTDLQLDTAPLELLELGCGNGSTALWLLDQVAPERALRIEGIDISERALTHARSHAHPALHVQP